MKAEISDLRSEIARSIRAVRLSCFGRKCLRDCLRRMAAAAPHPRATRRRWGVAAAAVLLCLGAFAEGGFGGVVCQWHRENGHYICEGTGNQIVVTGGADNVITNMFGGCTNCISVTPQQCENLKAGVDQRYSVVLNSIEDAFAYLNEMRGLIDDEIEDIDTYRRFGIQTSSSLTLAFWATFTNYLYSVDNGQTSLGRQYSSSNSQFARAQRIAFNDGIYDYATENVKSRLNIQTQQIEDLASSLSQVSDASAAMHGMVFDNLVCSACSTNSGDSCDCNESTGGRWCTEEQGDAIIKLLTDTKDYVDRIKSSAEAISNNVAVVVRYLHDGFFTSYLHIPTEHDLGMRWQDLYFDGYSSNFEEYASSNILARIELLLAGMSGILTNSDDFASAGDFAESGVEATNQIKSAISDFTNQVSDVIDQRERNVRTVGDSLKGLYNAFNGWTGTSFSRQTLINSYSVEIGGVSFDVPSFEPSENGLQIANLIRSVCRSIMSVVYILFSVAVFIRFHLAFFQWVLKYLKWGIELMHGLFA